MSGSRLHAALSVMQETLVEVHQSAQQKRQDFAVPVTFKGVQRTLLFRWLAALACLQKSGLPCAYNSFAIEAPQFLHAAVSCCLKHGLCVQGC